MTASSTARRAPPRINDPVREARIDLAAAFRCAARWDWQEGVGGHFSLRVPGHEDLFLINPVGSLWSEMRASDLLIVDLDGRKVDGAGEVERTAFVLHAHIHRSSADAHCVIHTHTPYAVALSVLKTPCFELIHQNGLRLFGDIAYDSEFNGAVTADEEGARIASVMGGKRAIFLANHGTIVTGPTVARTFQDIYTLERGCMYLSLARSHGMPLQTIDVNTARETKAFLMNDAQSSDMHFPALKRKLDREEPDYAD